MIIGAILEAKLASSVGIIGGADGPTAVIPKEQCT
jgi:Na+-transporting methylmalonyl-CoA/oxaloacetate decarboxylase beta subunit